MRLTDGFLLQIRYDAIECFGPCRDSKAHTGECPTGRRDVQPLMGSLKVSPENNLHRILNGMGEVFTGIAAERDVDLSALIEVVEAERPQRRSRPGRMTAEPFPALTKPSKMRTPPRSLIPPKFVSPQDLLAIANNSGAGILALGMKEQQKVAGAAV